MSVVNRIVTRGMGASRGKAGNAGLVTQGYGGIFIEIIQQIYRHGRSSYRHVQRDLSEIVISVKLMLVNDEHPTVRVEGRVNTSYQRIARNTSMVIEHVSS
jgi:hypothetical protein